MLILAVDSSSDRLRLGIADEDRILSQFDGPEDRSHSEKIITEIDSLLARAEIIPPMLDCLAVTSGPGSFTGLRVGIATVLGLAQAWQKEIITAGNMALERAFFGGSGRQPIVVIHSRGDQFYLTDKGEDIAILDAKEIAARYPDGTFAGPGVTRLQTCATALGLTLSFESPPSYSGGELARMFARSHSQFSRLDPVDLDINYLLKSQPEQRRDAAKSDFVIAEMTEGDLDDVLIIERDSFSDAWDCESFKSDVDSPDVITLAAKNDGRCIGYAICIALDDYGYISNIAVDGGRRSTGVGRSLLEEVKQRLQAKEIRQIVLDVRVSNQRAISFYERHGFSIITRRRGFYSNPPEDSFTMQLSMSN